MAATDPRARLTTAVLSILPALWSFTAIQRILGEQSLALFGLAIDFTQRTNGTPTTKETIDTLMGFGPDATREDYVEALLGACALNAWETLPTPPFYSIPAMTPIAERTEQLSILTQFFLANLNVYCKARGISDQNFGVILDTSPDLSDDLIREIFVSLTNGDDVERVVCNFCNVNADKFHLSRALNTEDLVVIRQIFERTYRTVTATSENPHMDDFMVLDKGATGETAKFVTHQGSICVNFADIIDPTAASINPEYFTSIRADFAIHPTEIPHRNEFVAGDIEINIEALITQFDEQFEHLPTEIKEACRAHPNFQTRYFLQGVAKGRQEKVEALLTATPATPANLQILLQTPDIFTDYSGRTFNCTAYEYAYWAKDTHMRRMLERYMDEETKAQMLARIDTIEAEGLSYQHNGVEHQSAHFDLTMLRAALQAYLDGYDTWTATSNWAAMGTAWMEIGKAQRDVPAHVAHEYCRLDRSFQPCPPFDEPTLPRVLTCSIWTASRANSWFPLSSSNSGLGFDFVLTRVGSRIGAIGHKDNKGRWRRVAAIDLMAITHLDDVRTADLTDSREYLSPPVQSYCTVM